MIATGGPHRDVLELAIMSDLARLHVRHEQTGGGFVVVETVVAPGGGPPPLHIHPAGELFWTLEGELSYFHQDEDGAIVEVTGGPGTSTFVPGGVPHTYRNFSDRPAAYLGVLSPPQQIQEFLLAVGVPPGELTSGPEEVLAIGARFGIVTLDVVPQPRGS